MTDQRSRDDGAPALEDFDVEIARLPAWVQNYIARLQDTITLKDEQILMMRQRIEDAGVSWYPSAADLLYAVDRLSEIRRQLKKTRQESGMLAELLENWAEHAGKGATSNDGGSDGEDGVRPEHH